MKLHASGEDYLEAILMLQKKSGMVRSVDLARHMGFSKPSISHAVGVLKNGGFLTVDDDGFQMCIRDRYSTTRLKAEGLSVYTIKPELYEVGLTTGQTPFGHTVPVYDMGRTICDLLRSRSSMERQTFQGALKMYARRKDKDLRTLMRYAGMFRVEKILRQYLEVLL